MTTYSRKDYLEIMKNREPDTRDYSLVTKIIQYTDAHLGAPHHTESTIDMIIEDFLLYKDDPTVLVLASGDIVDIKNCKRKKAPYWESEMWRLKCTMGRQYKFGNHEAEVDPDGYNSMFGDICLFHDHLYSWCGSMTEPCEKVISWEHKKSGMTKFRYFAYRFKHLVIKRGKLLKPSTETLKDYITYANEVGAKVMVYGHTHKLYDEMHSLYWLMTGKELVELPENEYSKIMPSLHNKVQIICGGRDRHVWEIDREALNKPDS